MFPQIPSQLPSMLWCYGVLLLLFLEPLVGGQLVFDNQIEGSPEISCGHGQINFKVKTTKGTPSSIYVKGNSDNKDCVIRDSENASIPLNTCNMRRKREVNPAGIGYAMTIIVQLHPLFVTKVDRAYNVHCFYMEAHKNIDTELFVSDITTQTIQSTPPLPQCTYTIHKDTPNGPKIKYARVGDQLYHVWECPSDVYGMLLHTCEAVDGTGNKYMIVDGNGCSSDEFLLPQIMYNYELTRSMVGTYAFNFPDRTSMIFSCQIQLCFKQDDCAHITPPKCGARGTESSENIGLEANEAGTSLSEELDTDQVFTSLPVTIPSTINGTTKNETHARIKNLKSIKGNPTKMPADFPTPGTILPVKDMPIEGSGEEEERISEERVTSALPERAETSTIKLLKKVNRTQRDTPVKPIRQINFDISSPELTIMEDLGRLDPSEQIAPKQLFDEPTLPSMHDKICISSLGFFTFAGLVILFSVTVFCILFKSRKTVHKFY